MDTPWTHLENILAFGPRLLGSPANQAAADYLIQAFQALGYDTEAQPYACTGWEHKAVFLELDGDTLDCAANAFSLPCDVTAEIVPAASIPELEAVSVQGKILLLYGDLARWPLSPKSWFLKDERADKLINLLETLKPAAVLAPPTATDYYNQLTEDAELDISAATVSEADALRLLKSGSPAHLKIDARRFPAEARNILARRGADKGKRVVICAHFDTKINTPGASDNAGGVASMLGIADALKDANLPFGLEFVAFNGEEYLPMGDDEYLRRSESYFNNIRLAVNLDGNGTALGTTSITAMSAPEQMEASFKNIAAGFPGLVWVDPWPESNHSTFAFREIPAIAISAVGTRKLAHSVGDTIDVMSADKLDEAVKLVCAIVKKFPHS